MLIIPVEHKLDWRHPPWVTLFLMLLCLLVFSFYQSDDDRYYQSGVAFYQQQSLHELEAPAYRHYLQRRAGLSEQQALEQTLALDTALEAARENGENLWLAWQLAFDRDFYHYLKAHQPQHLTQEQAPQWLAARQQLHQEHLDYISVVRHGLVPGQLSLSSLVSYQFLHGSWGHLLGNLLFLFLFGFTVERALGGGRFLLAYLLCGSLAGLGYAGLSWQSQTPLVGASGSISGLMGMYLMLFGLRKIRFFYYVGVYFNYFRAPALVILPVWLGKELFDHWQGEATAVAHMAHVGGLVAGAGLVALFGKSWLQSRESFHGPTEDEAEARFRHEYGLALGYLSRLEFATARLQFQTLQERYPQRPQLLTHCYQLAKLRPDLPDYREATEAMLARALRQHDRHTLVQIWQEYQQLAPASQPLPPASHNQVLLSCLKDNKIKEAEKAFAQLQAADQPLLTEEACRLLKEACERLQLASKARQYQKLLVTLAQ
ncbi:MAG: rhomboid family intramembrane serine protease [Halomonadaceae bacterium]|nr:MAG: rhomboid family intramembrane serine protease [Halomonadaceae bacterium]